MALSIKFNQFNSDAVERMRQAILAEGWAGSPGFKCWARETYSATLHMGAHDWTRISFKTQEDMHRFSEQFGFKTVTVEQPQEDTKPATPDLLGRPIHAQDYVVFHNRLYVVEDTWWHHDLSVVQLVLVDRSASTKSVVKNSTECCVVNKEDVMFWMLKR
jgi:hypothetical protein